MVSPGSLQSSVGLYSPTGAPSPHWLLPVHPSNPILFPNLTGIWPHYQRYSIPDVRFESSPTASMLAGGTVVQATLAPGDLVNGLGFSMPSFVELLNYAASAVWPVAGPLVSRLATGVLNRAKSFLTHDANLSLTTPAYIAGAAHLQPLADGGDPTLPLIKFVSTIRFHDFRPGSEPDIAVDRLVVVTPQVTTGNAIDYRPWFAIDAAPGITVASATYPATAPIQPVFGGSWTVDSTKAQGAMSLTGYAGQVRVLVSLSSSTTVSPVMPFNLLWLPTSSTVPRTPVVEYHFPGSSDLPVASLLFDVHEAGTFYASGLCHATAASTPISPGVPVGTLLFHFIEKASEASLGHCFAAAKSFKTLVQQRRTQSLVDRVLAAEQ